MNICQPLNKRKITEICEDKIDEIDVKPREMDIEDHLSPKYGKRAETVVEILARKKSIGKNGLEKSTDKGFSVNLIEQSNFPNISIHQLSESSAI